jgi:hypothetical protein
MSDMWNFFRIVSVLWDRNAPDVGPGLRGLPRNLPFYSVE